MCRILIVEDDPELREQLVKLFFEEFTDASIDEAESVEMGLELVEKAAASEHSYDVAILDFKLPFRVGEHEYVDESVCMAIDNASPQTLVVHITGYPDDSDIQRHLIRFHVRAKQPRAEYVSKLKSATWPEEVLGKVKSFHYGGRIMAQMHALFRLEEKEAPSLNRMLPNRRGTLGRDSNLHGEQSATHTLAALMRDIIAHWSDLDESQKESIRVRFKVDEMATPVTVCLR